MLKDRKALIEEEMKQVHKLAASQYFNIALFAKHYKDPDYEAERFAYETTLQKYNKLKQELAQVQELIEQGSP
jgi:hypothetical protein